ncbi:antibiotic biosynthesis monooxygenase [Rahnella bruchi]|uniref:antibiotic biosynthesis monooxygenase n=1 Tax=Rahnella bruchi TaxID=1510573 RepID=UPI000EA27B13|nr:antibiotic biosynthesis monooxygenase [Rahnella bruchi]
MTYPHQPDHITLVITHGVQRDKLAEYELWLENLMADAARFAGYQSVNVLRPVHGETIYTLLVRFDNIDNLYQWIQSDQREIRESTLANLLIGQEYIEMRMQA